MLAQYLAASFKKKKKNVCLYPQFVYVPAPPPPHHLPITAQSSQIHQPFSLTHQPQPPVSGLHGGFILLLLLSADTPHLRLFTRRNLCK